MNEILIAKEEGEDIRQIIEDVSARYPVLMRKSVKKAFLAADQGDYEQAAGLCSELLDYEADPEVRMLLGTCYFTQGEMLSAEKVFLNLTEDYPERE